MQELQAEEQRREPQWHPRELFAVEILAPQPQPDGPNPNAAESMVEIEHRAQLAAHPTPPPSVLCGAISVVGEFMVS
jgi:hypothetical protein